MVPDRPLWFVFWCALGFCTFTTFFLCLSIVSPNVFVIRSIIFMLMTYKFICRGIGLIWMAWSLEWMRTSKPSIAGRSRMGAGSFSVELTSWVATALLFLGDIALEWKDIFTDLGLLIDCALRFGRHVTKICSRVYSTLHGLWFLKFLTPKSVRLKLCKAFLLPHFFTVIFFSLVCLICMVGACRWLLIAAQGMSLVLGGSITCACLRMSSWAI
jgi:hypothetical protein